MLSKLALQKSIIIMLNLHYPKLRQSFKKRQYLLLGGIKYFLFLSFVLIFNNAFSQEEETTQIYQDGASPNSSNIKKNLEIQPDYYRGTIGITIPIHEINEKGLKLPINMVYSSNSIIPDQPVNWIGLGWNLIAGGSITRKVNGIKDEFSSGHGYYMAKSFNNGFYSFDRSVFDGLTNNFTLTNNALYRIYDSAVDGEPDEFTLSLEGRLVKFYIDRDKNVISNSKIKFEFVDQYHPTFSGGNIISWLLTLENGTKYYFDQTEMTRVNINKDSYPPSGFVFNNSAWHLTKIESADGKNKIILKYDLTHNSGSTNWSVPSRSETFMKLHANPTNGSQIPTHFWIYDTSPRPAILKSIESSDQIITFLTSASGINSSQVVLNRIEVKQKDSRGTLQKIKGFQLNVARYSGDKMLLKELKEEDGTGLKSLPPYIFTYDERFIQNTFDITTNNTIGGVDHWGYYNGVQPVARTSWERLANSRLPQGINEPKGMDRAPNESYAGIGLLTSMISQKSGYSKTIFEYEQNDYGYVGSTDLGYSKIAGGARIKKISDSKGVRTFSYKSSDSSNPYQSSGVALNEPNYRYDQQGYTPDNVYYAFSFYKDSPINPIDIGYSEVLETYEDGSKNRYRYTSAREYGFVHRATDKAFMGMLNYDGAVYFKLLDHPFKPENDRFYYMRGLPSLTTAYNSNGTKLSEISFEYSPQESITLDAFRKMDSDDIYRCNFKLFYLHSVGCGKAQLIKKSTKQFNADLTFFGQVNEYVYNPKNDQLEKETTTNSVGDFIEIFYTYPCDFDNGLMNGNIGVLKNKNIILPVVSKRVVLNNKWLTDISILLYDQNGNVTEKYGFESDRPILKEAITINQQSIGINNFLKKKINYIYNSTTNLLEEVIFNDNSRVSYKRNADGYIIAEIRNASPNEVFYENYEYSGAIQGEGHTGKGFMNDEYLGQEFTPYFPLPNSREYLLSLFMGDGGWKYEEHNYIPGASVYIGSKAVDDVCIYPKDAQITIYHYNDYNLLGAMIKNGQTIYYEYDSFLRPVNILDGDKNIVKHFDYNYTRQF